MMNQQHDGGHQVACDSCGSTLPRRHWPPVSRCLVHFLLSFLCGLGLVTALADVGVCLVRGCCRSCGRVPNRREGSLRTVGVV